MKQITLCLPRRDIHRLDGLVKAGYYPNKAEAIRLAVRDLLLSEAHLTRSDVHE